MTRFVDFTPASCRAKARERRAIRLWVSTFLGTVGIMAGAFGAINAGHSHRVAEREGLASQLKLQWDRNEEAKKLLVQVHKLDADITRYNKLASPLRASEVVAMLGAALPEKVSLTSLTLSPRQEKLAPAPAKPGERPAAPRILSQIAVEVDGVAPTDGDVSALMSALETNPVFSNVAMEFARSTVIDGIAARAFRVSGRIDLSNRYAFHAPGQTPDAATPSAPAAPVSSASADAQPGREASQ